MSRKSQIDLCMNLTDQIIAIWLKMGGKYAEWREREVHDIIAKRLHMVDPVPSFESYSDSELTRATGMLFRVLAGYKSQWEKQWKAEVAAREEKMLADERTIEECYTWQQVQAWMAEHAPAYKPVEWFYYERTIARVSYWRKRDAFVRLLTEREARTEYSAYEHLGHGFDDMYTPTAEPGWEGTLYKRRFKVN